MVYAHRCLFSIFSPFPCSVFYAFAVSSNFILWVLISASLTLSKIYCVPVLDLITDSE